MSRKRVDVENPLCPVCCTRKESACAHCALSPHLLDEQRRVLPVERKVAQHARVQLVNKLSSKLLDLPLPLPLLCSVDAFINAFTTAAAISVCAALTMISIAATPAAAAMVVRFILDQADVTRHYAAARSAAVTGAGATATTPTAGCAIASAKAAAATSAAASAPTSAADPLLSPLPPVVAVARLCRCHEVQQLHSAVIRLALVPAHVVVCCLG